MEVKPKVKKFQEGGPAPAPANQPMPAEPQEGAPVEGGADRMLMQLAQMAAEALQSGDCNTALSVCEAFMQLIQQFTQGQAGPEAPQGEPVYRKGGKLVGRIRK
jgi:hypothetical protein|nr:MAG TPA: hypothetical protein [Caudoviricetes sp.]